MNNTMTIREQLIETVNRLFIYTDDREWYKLQEEVFSPKVWFDMSSAGGGAAMEMSAAAICEQWETGFKELDAIHHQAGTYLVSPITETRAEVYCYAIALHHKKDPKGDKQRQFVGSYDITLEKLPQGWRINAFKYNLKYISGEV